MVTAQMSKIVPVTVPVAIVDNAAWTTIEVDTQGFEFAVFYLMLGSTDIAVATFKLQESAASGAGFVDIVGAIFGTSTNTDGSASTLPSATDDGKVFAIEVDLRNRKRYLDLSLVAGDGTLGTYMTAWAVLSRAHDVPMSAAERGCSQILRV